MMGRRVLLPCSEALQGKTADVVRDFGGMPLPLPLIRMTPEPACIPTLKRLKDFDWLVVTSPSSVHMLWRLLQEAGVDIRHLPRILTAGPGTTEAFGAYGIVPEITPPRNFGADGLLETVRQSVPPGAALLRLRSQRAGPDLVDALAAAGYRADDCVLYRNDPLRPERIPAFDAVFFASASAVESFMALQPAGALTGKTIVAMGKPTLTALEKHGVHNVLTPPDATVDSAIEKLAAVIVEGELEKRS
jgi:uroporphyrinogen-III synthase